MAKENLQGRLDNIRKEHKKMSSQTGISVGDATLTLARDVTMQRVSTSSAFQFDFDKQMVCPFCGCENTHIERIATNDPRLPSTSQGNAAIEMYCEVNWKEHKWIIGILEHKGTAWMIQLLKNGW